MSDIIGQALVSTANALAVRKTTAKIPYSRINHEIFKVLERHGFIARVERACKKEKKYLDITLKYSDDRSGAFRKVRRLSRPGKRIYAGYRELKWPRGVLLVISTPQGVMTGPEAKKRKLGGELICSIS